jgi:hypothetical protein
LNKNLEHEHMIEGRAAALRPIGPRHCPHQIRPEQFKVHDGAQPFELVAFGRELLQPFVNIEEPSLTPHSTPQPEQG